LIHHLHPIPVAASQCCLENFFHQRIRSKSYLYYIYIYVIHQLRCDVLIRPAPPKVLANQATPCHAPRTTHPTNRANSPAHAFHVPNRDPLCARASHPMVPNRASRVYVRGSCSSCHALLCHLCLINSVTAGSVHKGEVPQFIGCRTE
jgi:hypothetical protein